MRGKQPSSMYAAQHKGAFILIVKLISCLSVETAKKKKILLEFIN